MEPKPEDFAYVRELLYKSSAICIEPGQEYLLEARLGPIMRSLGLSSISALVERLRSEPARGLHEKVIDALTTNETAFFRDGHPFDFLKSQVLPRLIKAREGVRRLDIWCGACATGQEPYSIAMTLREAFPELASWSVRILATDLSGTALERAREGRYSALEVGRGLTPAHLSRYFDREGKHDWRVRPVLREMVEFRPQNLITPWHGIKNVDLLFLRNVLIYFDVATRKAIFAKMRTVLAPDGVVFLGCAETMNVDDSFECHQSGRTLFYALRARAA